MFAYYRLSSAVVLIYDISDRQSFTNIEKSINEIEAYWPQNVKVALVGNKSDLEIEREVSYEEGSKLAKEYSFSFYETSAKEDINIKEIFHDLAIDLKAKSDKSMLPQNFIKEYEGFQLQNQNQTRVYGGCFGTNTCSI